jgi:small subunit ribosomal protein S1
MAIKTKPRVIPEIENPFSTGEDFAALFELEAANAPKEGSVIKGTILAIENDIVIIDVGLKSEGRVSIKDFPHSERENVTPGTQVDVFLEKVDNAQNETVVSRERAVREEAWGVLEKLYEKEEQVEGVIFGRVKGGFTVDVQGAVAFLPGSQVDVRPVKDVTPLMNIPQPFVILKMDRKRGNIVVSRRSVLEESRSAERSEALAGIAEGMVLEGMVKNITDYGAFIDLGALDGLLHVTDVSWKRISHPSEVIKLGETIKVKVIKFDQETKRISLGLKQLEDSPWTNAETAYAVGTRHKGTITNITDYGSFVELAPGIEGLVHISEMSWTRKSVHPSKIVAAGQEVEIEVLSIDFDKHRLSLGMKQCEANPWDEFATKYKIGDVMDCEVKSIADFGLFVGLGSNADGLVHISDLTWEADQEAVLASHAKGDTIQVKILDIQPDKERISLGVKQLSDNPYGDNNAAASSSSSSSAPVDASSGVRKGDIATFIVSEVNENGVEVIVSEGVTTFIKKADLAKDRVECRPDRFSKGDKVDAKVTSVIKGQVRLSIKALEIDEEKKAIAEFGSADSGAALGGILGVALQSAQKEADEKK